MYLGIEIGGTKLQLGVGDGESATLVDLVRTNVDPGDRAPDLLSKIAEAARPLLSARDIRGVGVGFGGPVEPSSGVIVKSHHVAGWDGFGLADWCVSEFGLPSIVGNDCDVAALAEAKHGAGRGRSIVLYVTVGTGVGAGLMVDGEPYAPNRFARMEIGHLRPGGLAIVEDWSSGPSIAKNARKLGLDAGTAQQVAAAARDGNQSAITAWDDAIRTLGWAIAQALTITAAEVVVVGGGVSLAGEEQFLRPLREQVRAYVYPPLADSYEIVPAALDDAVVVVGAVTLAGRARASS